MTTSGHAPTRLTCFALIAALEEDFRWEIKTIAERVGLVSYFPPDVKANAVVRFQKDTNDTTNKSDGELLEYTDFADLAKLLNVIKAHVEHDQQRHISELSNALVLNTQARNRVCHSRPLEPED